MKEILYMKKTVFILQDKADACEQLKQKFTEDGEYSVVGISEDGISALSIIEEKNPTFLITGLILPGYDGMSVIRKIRERGLNTKIIVLTAVYSDAIVQRSISSGADYFMAKPFNFTLLKEQMSNLLTGAEETERFSDGLFHKISLEEKISKIFINVGIPPHIKGYSFLREGVKMAVNDPEIINNITKKLYPSIGLKYSTTPSKVERAIRHAIEVAWNRGRIETINSILGVRAYVGAEKPTNGEFIALVADKMILEQA
jgi:two-component system response regulator (stage 0 sporulation protein A)